MKPCFYDLRPVPEDTCCRVHNPGHEQIGLHLRQAHRLTGVHISYAARHLKASLQLLRRAIR